LLDASGTRIALKTSTSVSWLVFDLHGSVAGLCPAGTSSLSDAYRYGGYGQQVANSGSSVNPYRYRGLLNLGADDLAGALLSMGARDYSSQLGTFTQEDSVAGGAANPATMNRFLYALANPPTLVDPDGHRTTDGGGGGGPIGGASEPVGSGGGASEPVGSGGGASEPVGSGGGAEPVGEVPGGAWESWGSGDTIAEGNRVKISAGPDEGASEPTTTEILQGHATAAGKQFRPSMFTQPQNDALRQNRWLYNLFRGERIDLLFRRSVLNDPRLTNVRLTPRGVFGPDVLPTEGEGWWDVTTTGSWARHAKLYLEDFGEPTSILTYQ
jgi:RHS repeat-associated protein